MGFLSWIRRVGQAAQEAKELRLAAEAHKASPPTSTTEALPDGSTKITYTYWNGTQCTAIRHPVKPQTVEPYPDGIEPGSMLSRQLRAPEVASATKKRRKRLTDEERDAKLAKEQQGLLRTSRRLAGQNQNRMARIGITRYTWQTSEDERVCDACAANNGKKFSWKHAPATGHPGIHQCEGEGHCRCNAIPEFDI